MKMVLALIRTELTLLRRNATAASTAVAIPFAFGAFWVFNEPDFGEGWGSVIVLQAVTLLAFTLHVVGTMTLAGRREQLVLKRWRSSQAGPAGVLAGTVGMYGGLVVLQAVALTLITVGVSGQQPASWAMLAVGLIAGVAVTTALTFLVSAFTSSSEHAMITTFPVVAVLVGAGIWTVTRPFEAIDWPVLALPGGAATQLLRLGWSGPTQDAGVAWLVDAWPSLAATVVLTVVATVAAVRHFRWEPRH